MTCRTKGVTSQSLLFRLLDATTGEPKPSLTITNLSLQYARTGAAAGTTTALGTIAADNTAWASYTAREVHTTGSPGVYRVDCPDAAFATGADEVEFTVTGAAIKPATRLIELLDVDVRKSGGVIPVDQSQVITTTPTTGTVGDVWNQQLNDIVRRGTAQAGSTFTITLDAGASATDNLYKGYRGRILTGTGVGQRFTILSYVGATKVATIGRKGDPQVGFDTVPDATSTFLIVDAQLTSVGLIGGQQANSSGTITFPAATLASTTNITAATGITVSTNNDKTGYTLTVTPPTSTAIATAVWTDLLASSDFSTAASIGKLLKDDIDGKISQIMTTAMVESYAANGVAPTPAQALLAIQQYLYERTIASTTETIRKLDHTTPAATVTTNSASVPTSKIRAS